MKKIHKDMTIIEITESVPESLELFSHYDLHCAMCHSAQYETLQDGCEKHGLSSEEINELLDELNKMLKNQNNVNNDD